MIVSPYLVDIIFNILKGTSLVTLTPIRVKCFDGSTDITNTLFGYSYLSLATTVWGSTTSKTIANSQAINFGDALTSFTGVLTLKFYTTTDEFLFSLDTISIIIAISSNFTIGVGNISITLDGLETPLASFLLNYLFRNVTTSAPTSWYAQLVLSNGSNVGSRSLLPINGFSPVYLNELGHKQVHYSGYNTISVTGYSDVAKVRLYTTSFGGNPWFELTTTPYFGTYSSTLFEIYSNTLKLTYKDLTISGYVLTNDPSVIFYATFDGLPDNQTINGKLSNSTIASYDVVNNLFNGECASFGLTDTVGYSDFEFPQYFTLDFFVYFSTAPSGRTITLLNRSNSFRLIKTSTNRLQLDLNASNVIDIAFTPSTNTWYHIYISRTTDHKIKLKTTGVDVSSTISSGFQVVNNGNNINIGASTNSIGGLINGLVIRTGEYTYVDKQLPLPRYPYVWKLIDKHIWKNIVLNQWKEYYA